MFCSRRFFAPLLLISSWLPAQQTAPQFFHINPVRPVAELRAEALKASPPPQVGDFRKPDLVELVKLDPTIKLDIRYATSHNFLSTPVYEQARAFMERPAAEAVVRASKKLHQQGLGLLIYDAYRPWFVTKIFWDATPPEDHKFVADPSKGSQHNRGCAVDLTLYDLKTGEPVPMTGLYDEMSERSYPNYTGGTEEERRNREILRSAMESEGFTVYEYEWWHFDYKDWKQYPVLNIPFDKIGSVGDKNATAANSLASETLIARDDERNHGPRAINTPDPVYDHSEVAGTKQTVVIKGTVEPDGSIDNLRVLRSENPKFTDPAMKAVAQWKFKPFVKDGVPVPRDVNVEVNFERW